MKKKIILMMTVLMALAFCGCSYKELDDKLQGKSESLPDTVQSTTESTSESNESEVELNDKNVGGTHLLPMDPPKEGSMEVTLRSKQVFDSIKDSGLDTSECVIPQMVVDKPELYVCLLLDIEIKNIDAKLKPGFDEELPFLISDLFPITEVNPDRPELGKYYAGTIYFSDHPPITDTSTDYYHYNILPGETKNYQVGIIAPKADYENDNLWLSVGAGFGLFFELFD